MSVVGGPYQPPVKSPFTTDTFTVTNTSNSLPGSLRAAIQSADSFTAGSLLHFATINFDVSSGAVTIQPTTPLPALGRGVTVDGSTEPVRLDGSLLGSSADGLELGGPNDVVQDLTISGFRGYDLNLTGGGYAAVTNNTILNGGSAVNVDPGWGLDMISSGGGIGIETASTGNNITGNFIGTDSSGDRGYGFGNVGSGINVYSSGNTITHNVVSGNTDDGTVFSWTLPELEAPDSAGIYIAGSHNTLLQNHVGTNPVGKAAIGNGTDVAGIWIVKGADYNTIGQPGQGNLISGNAMGMEIDGDYNTVSANYIGTAASGEVALPNSNWGIGISGNDNVIGGDSSAAGNLISGNDGSGVFLIGATGYGEPGAGGNQIIGNFIGTDHNGTEAIANGAVGIADESSGNGGNTIGAAGAGNYICGNGNDGIYIQYDSGSSIQYNSIGVAPNGTVVGNGSSGVAVIGATGCKILFNSIYGNGGLGIDLNADGVTANHIGGPLSGKANGDQNYPVLASASTTLLSNLGTIGGTLNAAANSTYVIQFFSSPTADPSGYGQGKVYLGQTTVTTNGSGLARITCSMVLSPGQYVSATATDAAGNTSEFSNDVSVIRIPVISGLL